MTALSRAAKRPSPRSIKPHPRAASVVALRVIRVLFAVFAVIAIAFFGLYFFVIRYVPVATRHLPAGCDLTARVSLLDFALYGPVRRPLLSSHRAPSPSTAPSTTSEKPFNLLESLDREGIHLQRGDVREIAICARESSSRDSRGRAATTTRDRSPRPCDDTDLKDAPSDGRRWPSMATSDSFRPPKPTMVACFFRMIHRFCARVSRRQPNNRRANRRTCRRTRRLNFGCKVTCFAGSRASSRRRPILMMRATNYARARRVGACWPSFQRVRRDRTCLADQGFVGDWVQRTKARCAHPIDHRSSQVIGKHRGRWSTLWRKKALSKLSVQATSTSISLETSIGDSDMETGVQFLVTTRFFTFQLYFKPLEVSEGLRMSSANPPPPTGFDKLGARY